MAAEAAWSSSGPERCQVAAVVREAEGTMAPAECFEVATSRCAVARVCKLRDVPEQAMRGVLEQYTLQDLVRDRAPHAKILFLPPRPRARR